MYAWNLDLSKYCILLKKNNKTIHGTSLLWNKSMGLSRIFTYICHWTHLMTSQHRFKESLGVLRQQAIPCTNIDSYLCRHMALCGCNETTILINAAGTHKSTNTESVFMSLHTSSGNEPITNALLNDLGLAHCRTWHTHRVYTLFHHDLIEWNP